MVTKFYALGKAEQRRNKKRASQMPWPFGLSCDSHRWRDAKKLGYASNIGVFAYLSILIRHRFRFSAGQKGKLNSKNHVLFTRKILKWLSKNFDIQVSDSKWRLRGVVYF
jgi:hypothetical protein